MQPPPHSFLGAGSNAFLRKLFGQKHLFIHFFSYICRVFVKLIN
ncbi:hypothetical protein HMPREF1981_01772 [Bacteroides pyogenes F0041]|uniref:Uncharacterized protein n=1 Tax=Bacteroides pyogenes F0041 TaxID=1321819 RepID=U2CMX9_9BACE|nr:hypothetical protein HMPREF1981_01772 [Bacteroides pyogenes F0041]